MAHLTKAEKKVLKDFGNDPNYRIETNSRNKIVAIQLNQTITLNAPENETKK